MTHNRPPRPVHPQAACRLADEAVPTGVDWLWRGRIPLGKLTLLVGDPGVGKSLLAADVAARLSRGLAFPDTPAAGPGIDAEGLCRDVDANSSIRTRPHIGRIVIASSDDALDDTLSGRLAAAGADLSLVTLLEGVVGPDAARLRQKFSPGTFPNGSAASFPPGNDPFESIVQRPADPNRQPFSLAENFEILEQTVRGLSCPRLVVLDTLPALLTARSGWQVRDFAAVAQLFGDEAFAESSGRQLLTTSPRQLRSVNSLATSLVHLASRHGVAIVGITHLARDRGMSLLQRVRAPLAMLAAARSVLLVSRDATDGDRRILLSLKNTMGTAPAALAFRISESGPRIEWDEGRLFDENGAAHAENMDRAAEARRALSEAVRWLVWALSAGSRASVELLREARNAGITPITLRRAKGLLAIVALRQGETWTWSLPRTQDNRI